MPLKMKRHFRQVIRFPKPSTAIAWAVLLSSATVSWAGGVVPPQAIDQFEHTTGDRVEAVTILGGDYSAASGIYTFRSGSIADLNITKFGGGGDIGEPMELGIACIRWVPIIQGNVGHIVAVNQFEQGYLNGNDTTYSVTSVQFGGGARFYLTDHWSLAPSMTGIYGHTENEFKSHNLVGDTVKKLAQGTFVDWQIDTWSVAPAFEVKYEWQWYRTAFELSSHYTFFHTESFKTTSPLVNVTGESQTWENRLDIDIPTGLKIWERELHTGGFLSRSQLFGGIASGLNDNHINTVNGRFVFDFKGKLWKVRWLGFGASYFFGGHFDGWSAGADVRFDF